MYTLFKCEHAKHHNSHKTSIKGVDDLFHNFRRRGSVLYGVRDILVETAMIAFLVVINKTFVSSQDYNLRGRLSLYEVQLLTKKSLYTQKSD